MSFRTSISVLRLRAFLLALPLFICFNAYADSLTVERLKSLSTQQLVEHCEQLSSVTNTSEVLATRAFCDKKIKRLAGDEEFQPEFVSLTVSQNDADVTDNTAFIKFELTIYSPDRAVEGALLTYVGPEDGQLEQTKSDYFEGWEEHEPGYYTSKDTISFNRNSVPGVWTPHIQHVVDSQNNRSDEISAEAMEAAGSTVLITITNENELDDEPPSLVDIQFSATEIDILEESVVVDVTLTVYEDQGPTTWQHPARDAAVYFRHVESGDRYVTSFRYYDWSETDEENVFTASGTETFGLNTLPGEWVISIEYIIDANDNRNRGYDSEELSELGFQSKLIIRNSNELDLEGPQILGIDIDPPSVDTSQGPQKVLVTLEVEDRSGWELLKGSLSYGQGISPKFNYTQNTDRDLTNTTPQLEFEFDETDEAGQWRLVIDDLVDPYYNRNKELNNNVNHLLYGFGKELFIDVNHDSSELPDIGLMRPPIYTRRPGGRHIDAEFHIGKVVDLPTGEFTFRLYFTEERSRYGLGFSGFELDEIDCTRYTIFASCRINPGADWDRGILYLHFPGLSAEHIGFGVNITSDGYERNYTNNVHFTWETAYNAAAFMPDFDGDGIADIGVYRPSTQQFLFKQSSDDVIQRITFEDVVDAIPIYGDFDNDEITDPGLYEPSTNRWVIIKSSTGERSTFRYGVAPTDLPVPADYDGDGITDFAYKSMTTNEWKIRKSTDYRVLTYTMGDVGDLPVIGDFDDDWRIDVGVRQPEKGMWLIRESESEEVKRTFFGSSAEDIAVTGDFDGDGISDQVVRRPSSKRWFVRNSGDGSIYRTGFSAQSDDIPIIADYDGDGIADLASRRPSRGLQFVLNSSNNTISRLYFGGLASDIPIAAPVHIKMEMMNEQQQEQVVEFDEKEPIDELFEATEQVLEVEQLPH